MEATLPMETRARVRAVLAEVRGLHLCVLFADGACELHCLSAASPPPVVLQRVSSAAFIPPALPNSAAVVACCVGHQLVLALSAAPRAGFVCGPPVELEADLADSFRVATCAGGQLCLYGAQGEVRFFAAEMNVSSKGVVEAAIVPQGRYCIDGPCCSALLCRTHLLLGTEGAVQVCPLPPSAEDDLDCDLDHEIASGEESEGAERGEAAAAAAAAAARRGRRLGGTRCEFVSRGEIGEEVATSASVSELWLVRQLPGGARALALDAAGGLVIVTVLTGQMPQLARITLPCTPLLVYAIDRHRALHVLPLGALAAAGEGAAGAEAAGADTAGADGGAAAGGAVASAAWWRGDGPPALRASLTTLLPCTVHALAVLPPTPGAGGGVAPAVAVLAGPDSLRMLALG